MRGGVDNLRRAAWSLAAKASTSGVLQARAVHWGGLGTQHQIRSVHTSSSTADDATPVPAASVNPLQQAPSPLTERRAAAAADEDDASLYTQAILRGVAISPRKLNMFAKVLRGLHIEDALIQCKMHPKKSARICEKVLLSARANAANNHGLDVSKLKVDEAWVGRGQHLKRISMHGKGKSGTMHKYRSHLTVILKEEDNTRRRMRIVPMMAERKKMWDMREGREGGGKWWSWWPRRPLPPHVARRGQLAGEEAGHRQAGRPASSAAAARGGAADAPAT